MKKIGKLGLTIAMVLAMAIGTTATAFADTTAATVTYTAKTAISKTYVAAVEALLTETAFNYTLSYTSADKVGTNNPATPQYNNGDFTSKDVSVGVNKDLTVDETGATATGSITYKELFEGISFSAPGLYNFTLSEVKENKVGIVYDTTMYNIQVQVVWKDVLAGTVEVTSVNTYKGAIETANKQDNGATFLNSAADTGSLTVTKTVSGNAANKNDKFEFTVALEGVNADGAYKATIDGEPAEAATANGTNKYVLTHGQTLTIDNLPVGATYTVSEQSDFGGYDSVIDSSTGQGAITTDGVVSGTIVKGSNATTFENVKNMNPVTGVFMDVLPYALIVVVAAAACFFFMTRRRNREDY